MVIKQSIKRALKPEQDYWLPVHLVDRIAKMRKVTAKLADELIGSQPMKKSPTQWTYRAKAAHLKTVSVRPSSLDAPVGEEGDTTFGELVGDEIEATFENLQEKSMSSDIKKVISQLEDRS